MKLRPWEVAKMTIPEIILALDEDLEKTLGGHSLSPDEQRQYAEWRRSLSWDEKIRIAREG
jgi:hypothetical protein